ncbi:MAG: DUF4143 domain-containing protein [Gammaproteobacteria bacterium]|nr:DUF4143 domain-containing protein [Gammaproteobacteria bacterium]
MESVCLSLLSECEIQGNQPTFLSKLLSQEVPTSNDKRIRDHLIQRIIVGCFPEPLQRATEQRSRAWYQQYINSLIQSDILDLTHIDHPELMTKLFRLTAFYAGKLSNLSEMESKLGLSHVTIKKYMALLEQLFLVERLPAWHSNEYKRLIKTPKIHPTDTGIICAVRELNSKHLIQQPAIFGLLLGSFVEDAMGDCFAIEVKASATLTAKDFAGLERFKNIAGEQFKLGILLYDGDHTTAFGDRLFAVPIGALWA